MSTRYNTGNPIESTDVRDMSDNAKNLDLFSNSSELSFDDRFGVERKTIQGMIAEFDAQILNMGFSRIGTFTAGATLTNPRQTLLWDTANGGDGQEYGWSGTFPKIVPPSSTPSSTGGIAVGAWVSRFDPELKVQVREALRRSYAGAGYNLVDGSFEAGGTVASANDVMLYEADGKAYSWGGTLPKAVPAGSTPSSSGGISASAWIDRSLSPNAFKQNGTGAVIRSAQDKMREWVSLADFGGDPLGIALCDSAVTAARAVSKIIYVPNGLWRYSNPQNFPPDAYFYGPGKFVFDKAEVIRRGDSTGNIERYTVFYKFGSRSQVHVSKDGVEIPIEGWDNDNTFFITLSGVVTTIRYWVVNGTYQLGQAPTSLYNYNSFGSLPEDFTPGFIGPNLWDRAGNDNYGAGPYALLSLTTGGNNTVVGSRAGVSITTGGNNTLGGFQSGHRITTGYDNTAYGSVSLEWNQSGTRNAAFGQAACGGNISGSFNLAAGFGAGGDMRDGDFNTSVGYFAHGNNSTGDPVDACTSVGAYANRYGRGGGTVAVGYRALAGNGPTTGNSNIGIGFFAGRNITSGEENVIIGTGAAGNAGAQTLKRSAIIGFEAGANCNSDDTTAVGYRALNALTSAIRGTAVGSGAMLLNTANDATALGFQAGAGNTTGTENTVVGVLAGELGSTGSGNTDVGSRAGQLRTTGGFNVNIGRQAGQNNQTGGNNTNVGVAAGKFNQDGNSNTAFNNSTCIGASSAVSGSNQVQLGNSATTTYVYGTVQNRSDERDKTDIRNTELGIEFIMGLRPVDGRWDMRDDYWEEYDEQVGVDAEGRPIFETRTRQLPKDGSKARARKHHWFIAQEVKELCDNLGVDFGGYQDHTVNGGCDALSLGYDEFIPPTVKAVQQCWTRLDELEKRIAALE